MSKIDRSYEAHTYKVRDQLVKELKETTLSFQRLGEKYGVSRQAVFGFCERRGIQKPDRPKIEHTEKCSICRSLVLPEKTSRQDHRKAGGAQEFLRNH